MNWVEFFQNIMNLVVCASVSATLYAYYYVDTSYLNYAMGVIAPHFLIDLCLTTKNDIVLHHTLGLTFIAYKYYANVQTVDDASSILALYKTEISTFFYVCKLFLQELPDKKRFQSIIAINDGLFFITFFKYRILDFYNDIIVNPHILTGYSKYPHFYVLMFAIHAMFSLNLYWFSIICKIVCKPIIQKINNRDWLCHKITSYSLFFNVLTGAVTYTSYPNERNIYYVSGLFLLSVASYSYHDLIAKLIRTTRGNMIDYVNIDIAVPYLQDVGAIHLCSALSVVSHFLVSYPNIVWFSMVNHVSFFCVNIADIAYRNYTKQKVMYGEDLTYKLFIKFQYFCVMTPTVIDMLMIFASANAIPESIHGFYIVLVMGLLFWVMPFYELSHIAFHVCLIIHTYCCAKCNIYSIQRDENMILYVQ
jgi:hypothetical protein